MQVLALCRRRTEAFSEEAFAALLGPEAEAVRALYAAGVVRAAWTREDVLGAVLLLECASPEEARNHVDALPLGSAGMLDVTIVGLRGYRGFGPQTNV